MHINNIFKEEMFKKCIINYHIYKNDDNDYFDLWKLF